MRYLMMIYGNQEKWDTEERRGMAVEKYHAIEGGQQTLGNLTAYVTQMVRKGVED